VLSHELIQGADDFDLTDDGSTFIVTMQTDDNAIADDYVYEVQASVEGGLTSSIEGYKYIDVVCLADLVTSF
jgi:hypothetical protein